MIRMALSNPYNENERVAGSVGFPLPGVQVRLMGIPDGEEDGGPAEILVKSGTLFREYYKRPDATDTSFVSENDGIWFKTGDIGVRNDGGRYRILGRSIDIIKSGGYKISALEVENVLLQHPGIRECAVAGVPDLVWGERVVAFLALTEEEEEEEESGGKGLSLDGLRAFCKDKLASYKIPTKLVILDEIPKNAMGKVNKKSLLSFITVA